MFFTRAKVPVKFHTLVEDARISGQAYGTAQLWYVASRLEDVRRNVAKATGHRADIAAPESQAVKKIAEAIEASDTNSKATLEDIKYASSDMSTNASGKSNGSGKGTSERGKHGRHHQGALKPAADVASDPNAIANLVMSTRDRGTSIAAGATNPAIARVRPWRRLRRDQATLGAIPARTARKAREEARTEASSTRQMLPNSK